MSSAPRAEKPTHLANCHQWKQVKNFDHYLVNELGEIYSHYSQRLIKPWDNTKGSMQITLTKNCKAHSLLLGRIVLEAFVGDRPEGMECCHNDGNYKDCSVLNLRWGTKSSNMQDKIKHGNNWQLNKTHDKYGHEYNKLNTIIRKRGDRECKACTRARDQIRNNQLDYNLFKQLADAHYERIMNGA